jgi:4-amino-4-deoxy-L-arabinose transferase-like glycosyltransferase
MSRLSKFSRAAIDPLIALVLGGVYLALLMSTVKDLGYARDEGFYFQAARSYEGWFELLLKSPEQAFQRANVDRFWSANNEHPALIKSLFALSRRYLFGESKWIAEEGTAFRFPGMVLSSLAVSVTYLWGRRAVGRLAGTVGALGFAMMPAVFYHSHLDCFDMPVAAMWLFTSYAYWRSLEPGKLRWALATGILYGLLLDTKHNSWLLPPALIAHFVLARGDGIWRDVKLGRVRAPLALFSMALIGPVVFYALWPWIWHDTGARLAGWVAFHTGHEYYNMEFFGRTYWKPPMPRLYAPFMTIATVPGITLVLFAIGLVAGIALLWRVRFHRFDGFVRARLGRPPPEPPGPVERERFSTELLWMLCIAVSYAPWLSPATPIFGGTKHWLTAYPFMCLFGARGFCIARAHLNALLGEKLKSRAVVPVIAVVLTAASIVAPIVMTLHSHPWGLAAYTPIVGGQAGAATIGLNRTFWGYTTGAVQGFINQNAPPNTSVYVHDMAFQSWDQMIKDGRLRQDLRAAGTPAGSSFALYQHEPHMSRVEYQIWVDYGTTAPAHIGTFDGVPIVWVYARPGILHPPR